MSGYPNPLNWNFYIRYSARAPTFVHLHADTVDVPYVFLNLDRSILIERIDLDAEYRRSCMLPDQPIIFIEQTDEVDYHHHLVLHPQYHLGLPSQF